MNNRFIIKVVFCALMPLGIMSCSSLNGTVGTYFDMDTDLEVEFIVDADINPDEQGKASPLFVRMYELKNPKMMGKADFIDIYENDKDALGADLIDVHRLKRFKPGENRIEHFVLNKDTNYVAFFAEFLKYKDAKYKVIVPVVANNVIQTSAMVKLAGNDLIIERASGRDDNAYHDDLEDGVRADAKDAQSQAKKANGIAEKAQGLF